RQLMPWRPRPRSRRMRADLDSERVVCVRTTTPTSWLSTETHSATYPHLPRYTQSSCRASASHNPVARSLDALRKRITPALERYCERGPADLWRRVRWPGVWVVEWDPLVCGTRGVDGLTIWLV